MLRALQVRQARLGVQNGLLRVVFVALAILKASKQARPLLLSSPLLSINVSIGYVCLWAGC